MDKILFHQDRIVSHPSVCGGKPVIKGTSIRVLEVLDMIFLGFGLEEILGEYPQLLEEDVRACLQYASRRLHSPLLEKALSQGWVDNRDQPYQICNK
ncbi:PF04255 family protein [Leptospira broomii serovar Hurstbridge str. 5399]|uniref:PF04255 family protein n=1 Tax=Leptospira broomii serovar Hurstbridge str. 5399 TaxID=1049789 RepID=T0GHS3_9LEPT|nr:DUF433 domain-containing protein [Leptospira broomii]EQA44948.1 PF04255 family protein [Leptospira broomii serovar Hurstbridge str. 5399]